MIFGHKKTATECGFDFTQKSSCTEGDKFVQPTHLQYEVFRLKMSAGYFPGRHIVAQASIEHSNIAQSEQNCFTTEKSTSPISGNLPKPYFLKMDNR